MVPYQRTPTSLLLHVRAPRSGSGKSVACAGVPQCLFSAGSGRPWDPRSGPGRPVACQSHPLLAIALLGRRGGPRAGPARCGAFGALHQFKPACDGGPGRGG
jgi:hypothetical protein